MLRIQGGSQLPVHASDMLCSCGCVLDRSGSRANLPPSS